MAAEYFHYSGVMAVVSGGLFLSFRSHEIFNYNSRIQSAGAWSTVAFVLNGLVFILIGLQLPYIVDELGDDYTVPEAIGYGLIISVLTIVIRVIWVYPATFIPRWLSKEIRAKEARPTWKGVFLISWAGMRGVVSLASALSIPLTLFWGDPFPQRNLILFITFVVILFTLLVQGLTLPFLIRRLNIEDLDAAQPDDEQEAAVRLHLLKTAKQHIAEKYVDDSGNVLVKNLKLQIESNISFASQHLQSLGSSERNASQVEQHNDMMYDLIKVQRKELTRLRREKKFEDEVLRKHEAQLDLDEARLNHHNH